MKIISRPMGSSAGKQKQSNNNYKDDSIMKLVGCAVLNIPHKSNCTGQPGTL